MSMNAKITFISAGAGSGKTHRLTQLLHEELQSGSVRASGVIATTFTKKAAAELRERVREHLLKQGSWGLSNAIGQARIGTVNSVCGKLIERFAFEAGESTELQVLEESQASLLLSRAIDAVLDEQAMRELLALSHRLGLEDEWKEALQTLVTQLRTNDIALGRIAGFAEQNCLALLSHFPAVTKQDLSQALLQAILAVLPVIELMASEGGKDVTKKYLQHLHVCTKGLQRGSLPWSDWVKLSKMKPEAALKAQVESITLLAERYGEHPQLQQDLRSYLKTMFRLAEQALENYRQYKQELGALDFADQEHLLLNLLDQPDVATVLRDELDLLMVDEFQDTSPIQLALFLKLASFAKKVYWVGDIKQAIYGFRGSDTELMLSIINALPKMGASKEVLPYSWRSRPELVNIVNAVFAPAFANSLTKNEVELSPRRAETMPKPAFGNWILHGKNVSDDVRAVACGVVQLVQSGYTIFDKSQKQLRSVRYGDVAILSRTHDGVVALAAALSAQGIPVATAQPGLLATPEVTLALACLRRLNDPTDTIATAEIVAMHDGLEPEVWVADRLRYLRKSNKPDQWMEVACEDHPVHPLLAKIVALRADLPVMSPTEALESVMAICHLPETVSAWSETGDRARVRLANLQALSELARHYEEVCQVGQMAASISGLLLWLGEQADSNQDMLAEPAVDAIRIMTHHAAKGLEWPVVILTDLAKDVNSRLWGISAQSTRPFDVQRPLADRFIRYWPWPFGKQRTVELAERIETTPMAAAFQASAIEESKRLLYVSMTRARDLLILARQRRKLSGEWLDTVAADWLLQDEESDSITLPSGEQVSAMRWELDAGSLATQQKEEGEGVLFGFGTVSSARDKMPLKFNPSQAASMSATAMDTVQLGEPLVLSSYEDKDVLGTAIHSCIALSFTDRQVPLSEGEVVRVLDGYGMQGAISTKLLTQRIQELHQWIAGRWPAVTAHAEIPVQSVLANGQILNGRIDLLLDTADGWILIDHKSSVLEQAKWSTLAPKYAAQMSAYASAIEKATGRKVVEAWLFLPVAGGCVRMSVGAMAEEVVIGFCA